MSEIWFNGVSKLICPKHKSDIPEQIEQCLHLTRSRVEIHQRLNS